MNRNLISSVGVSCLVLMAGIGAMVGYQARATPAAMQRPTAAATVNLARVLEGLQQRADAEVRLKAETDRIRFEQERRETSLKAIEEQIKVVVDPVQRQQLDEKKVKEALDYQAWISFIGDKLDVERALLLQDLYKSINEAIAEMAEAEGFELVVVDDSEGELGWNDELKMSREAQTLQQIRSRRVLYRSPSVDVTDDLVARMNNAWRAGKP